MNILLDTCTFLWCCGESKRLSEKARQIFVDAENDIFLSAVSTWEISIKYGLGYLDLPSPPSRFVPVARTKHRIDFLALEETATLRLPDLPMHHKDPFDRMLVCQAEIHDMIILTPDPLIKKYNSIKTIW